MSAESKKTRIRRTNEQVDKAISDALTTLSGQMPLARITVNQLIAEAGIEATVFFKRYSSIDDLIYEYIRELENESCWPTTGNTSMAQAWTSAV